MWQHDFPRRIASFHVLRRSGAEPARDFMKQGELNLREIRSAINSIGLAGR